MAIDRRGRPRLVPQRRPGRTTRDEILDAAAELFTTAGYAATSTRRIAEVVGLRQASLYHHFATKDDILEVLLGDTVDPSLRLADELVGEDGPAAPRLHALAFADAAHLGAGRWNLGALYLLPELRTARFDRFRAARAHLRRNYRVLAESVLAADGGPAGTEDLPFRLVETVINRRSDDGDCPAETPWLLAEAALRVLGHTGDFAEYRRWTEQRLAA